MGFQTYFWLSSFVLLLNSEVPPSSEQPPASFPEAEVDDGYVIRTLYGRVRGRVFEGHRPDTVVAYLGVPYAEPPVRELRFRAPKPPVDWDYIYNATEFGPICWQPGEQKIYDSVPLRNRSTLRKRKMDNYPMSEDCLTVNIYVPQPVLFDQAEGGKVPVFFYVHGGSYYMGSGRLYPGQILAASQNIIVVTFNFRLGPLGFLSTEDLAASGNWGLLDQAQALDWVYHNVGFFGGNRDKITIVGNSAGGASAMFHLVSPMSGGKFSGITVQSGCSAAPWAVQTSPRKHALDLATKLGCPTAPTTDLVDCIRTFPPKTILKSSNLEDGLSLAYAAVIDGLYGGPFLSAHPDTLIAKNQFHHVPILAGFTRNEVTIWFTKWGPSSPTKHLKDFLHHDVMSLIRNVPTVTDANRAAAFHAVKVQYLYRYGIQENTTLGKTSAVSDFISDVGLKAPCIQEMNLLALHNRQPLFLYEFSYFSVDDVRMSRQEWIGSYHESDLQFIFGEPYLNYSNHLRSYDDKKISDQMMTLWANFVKFGTPTPPANPDRTLRFKWTNYTETNPEFAVLGLKSHMEKYFYTDRMLFWNFFFPIFRDYEFHYDSPLLNCSSWEGLQSNWVFWLESSVLAAIVLGFTILTSWRVRKTAKNIHIGNRIPHKVTTTAVSPVRSPSSEPCRNSLVIHAQVPCRCRCDESD